MRGSTKLPNERGEEGAGNKGRLQQDRQTDRENSRNDTRVRQGERVPDYQQERLPQ